MVEPSGAAGLAAALSGQFGRWNRAGAGWGKTMRCRKVGVVLCGGNVDLGPVEIVRRGCRPRRRASPRTARQRDVHDQRVIQTDRNECIARARSRSYSLSTHSCLSRRPVRSDVRLFGSPSRRWASRRLDPPPRPSRLPSRPTDPARAIFPLDLFRPHVRPRERPSKPTRVTRTTPPRGVAVQPGQSPPSSTLLA